VEQFLSFCTSINKVVLTTQGNTVFERTLLSLTVKPIPTVAEKVPVWNFPVSNCTSNDVFPTPLSPNSIVCNIILFNGFM
jgi:hypothetical protein